MKNKNIAIVAALVAALSVSLTACYTDGGTPNDNDNKPTVQPTAPATDEPVVIEAESGDVVDADAADAINASEGDKIAYPMSDGTWVVMPRNGEVPEAVQNDVNAKAEAFSAAYPKPEDDRTAWAAARAELAAQVSEDTGRTVITIVRVYGRFSVPEQNYMTRYLIVGVPESIAQPDYGDGGMAYPTAEAAQTAVDQYLSNKDAGKYIVMHSY